MSFDWGDCSQFPIDFENILKGHIERAPNAVYTAAMAFAADVQQSPSTPVDTGQYRNSIRSEPPVMEGEGPVCYIGSPMPQMFRLEFGFVGADALGRFYSQAPQPHWRPAFDNNHDRYHQIMATILEEGIL